VHLMARRSLSNAATICDEAVPAAVVPQDAPASFWHPTGTPQRWHFG